MTSDISIRGAGRDDAADLAALLTHLGHSIDSPTVIARLSRLEATGLDQVFVAENQERVVGLASLHITPALLNQDGPIARITALVVDQAWAQRGVERSLVAAIEELASIAGCTTIEVDSNTHADAQTFYETIGYTRSHELFRKSLISSQ